MFLTSRLSSELLQPKGLPNKGPQAKSNLLPAFVNKDLLERSCPICLCIVYLGICAVVTETPWAAEHTRFPLALY